MAQERLGFGFEPGDRVHCRYRSELPVAAMKGSAAAREVLSPDSAQSHGKTPQPFLRWRRSGSFHSRPDEAACVLKYTCSVAAGTGRTGPANEENTVHEQSQ